MKNPSRRGQAALEFGLLVPWIVVCFIAVLDFGFCCYGLIATQGAASAAAYWGAASTTNAQSIGTATQPCTYALAQLANAPNVGSGVTTCTSSPVQVSASYLSSGADGLPAVSVTVTYTVQLLAIAQIMPSSLAIARTVELPVL